MSGRLFICTGLRREIMRLRMEESVRKRQYGKEIRRG